MPSDRAIRSRNLGIDWTPEDNEWFNNLLRATDTREMFVKNLLFFMKMKGCDTHEAFAESLGGLSAVYIERGLKGTMPYHVACHVVGLCGADVERMFLEDLSEDHFFMKQAENRRSA